MKPLIAGSFQQLCANGYFAAASYITILIIARSMGVDYFGRYLVVVSILSWIELLTSDSFIHPLISAKVKGNASRVRRLISIQIFGSCLAAVGLIGLSNPLAAIFKDPVLAMPLVAAAFDIVPFAFFSVARAEMNARDAYIQKMWAAVVYGTAKLVFMGGAAVIYGRPAPVLAGMVMASITAVLFSRRMLSNSGRDLHFDGTENFQLQTGRLLDAVLMSGGIGIMFGADLWVLKAYGFESTVLSGYGAAQNLAKLMYLGGTAMMWPMIPSIARAGSACSPFQVRQLRNLTMLLLLGLAGGTLLFSMAPRLVLAFLYGPDFAGGVSFLRWLAPAYFILVLGMVLAQVLYHASSRRSIGILFSISAALMLAACDIGTRLYGPIGVIAGPCVAGLTLIVGVLVYFTRRKVHA